MPKKNLYCNIEKLRAAIEKRYRVNKWNELHCIKCDKKNTRNNPITLHHIQFVSRRPSLRNDGQNVVQICQSCHDEFHNIVGLSNVDTRKEFIKFIGRPIHYHLLDHLKPKLSWSETITDDYHYIQIKGRRDIFYLVRSEGC